MSNRVIVTSIVIIFLGVLFINPSVSAVCGDADGDTFFDIADLTHIIGWWFLGGPPPVSFNDADVDDYTLVTIRDLHFMIHDIFVFPSEPAWIVNCPPTQPKLVPTMTPNTNVSSAPNKAPSTTVFPITISFHTNMNMVAAVIPLEIKVNGQIPLLIDNVTIPSTSPFDGFDMAKIAQVDNTRGVVCFVFSGMGYTYSTNAVSVMATLRLTIASNQQGGKIEVNWSTFGPKQPPVTGDDVHYPMLLQSIPKLSSTRSISSWTPQYTCCQTPGDANHNGTVDISDLTFYVDYMFAGGPVPPCYYEADYDGNCSQDISDLTYFVSYLFGGGPPPVDCHLCP